MNGLANWSRLGSGLGLCFAATFLVWIAVQGLSIPPISGVSQQSILDLFGVLLQLMDAATGALGVTSILFAIFASGMWRWSIFRKLGYIKYPDLSGTWHATSHPAQWPPFNSIVTIDHSFRGIRMKLIRSQSLGQTLTAALSRTGTDAVRLYNIYDSRFSKNRPLPKIPPVDHGDDHIGVLMLDLEGEESDPGSWKLHGQYITNKLRMKDDTTRGTWGRIEMGFKRRELVSTKVDRLPHAEKTWLETTPVP